MELTQASHFASTMDRPIAGRRSTRPMLLGLAILLIGAAATAGIVLHPADRSLRLDAARLKISVVSSAPFHDFIPVRGQVVPLGGIVLDAVEGGRVEQILAEAGQFVTAGQPLIRLSDPSLELDAIARETQIIEQINSQRSLQLSFAATTTADAKAVADAEYNILRLQRQIARRQPLVATGFVSLELLDQTSDELAYQRRLRQIALESGHRDDLLIKKSLSLIDATSSRLEANLAAARRQIAALTVRAPADGVLTELDSHVGEAKTRGQHLGQIDRDGGFKVTVEIDEFYLARVKAGQHVDMILDGAPQTLAVAKIYPEVKSGKFTVDLAWQGAAPHGLRRGQALQGKLELGGDAPGLLLPTGPFLESTGGSWAFVLDAPGGIAVRRQIKLGRSNTETVEVLDGLKPGERVVTSDYSGLERIDRLLLSH